MAEAARSGRVTIRDIAERAGVSKGAVSYALNGRPGVSEDTRERILEIARELGWYPNRAARALFETDDFGSQCRRPFDHRRVIGTSLGGLGAERTRCVACIRQGALRVTQPLFCAALLALQAED